MQKYGLYGGAVVLILVIVGYLFYASDWRIGENWLPTRTSTIHLHADPASTVFLDNRKLGSPDENGLITASKVIPGNRTILVAREGYWPWTKQIVLSGGATLEFYSFAVPTDSVARVLTKQDPEYQKAATTVAQYGLPSNAKPLASADGTIELFVENEHLRARWIGNETETPALFCEGPCGAIDVLRADKSEIRDASFFGTRNDVVIVAVTNGVFAADLSGVGTQNFQPLYRGIDPVFAPLDEHTLYILDSPYYIKLEY